MDTTKTFSFTVPGLGTFEALGEVPPAKLFSRRDELATVCGGIGSLIDLESRVQSYAGSQNEVEKNIFVGANYELILRQSFIELKKTLVKTPEKFVIDQLNDEQFDALVGEYRKQKEFFRNPPQEKGKPITPDTSTEN